MTEQFFPADVSVRVEGNLADAQALFPKARNLLFRAMQLKEISGRESYKQFQSGPDGSLIWVALFGSSKHVYVQPGPRVEGEEEEEKPKVEVEETSFFPYSMYSGVVRPTPPETEPQIITVDDTLVLDQFHPSAVTASAYNLDFGWQQPAKLAVNDSALHAEGTALAAKPKPGNYSGAMKRVVQALYGIGWTETDTEGFISGELPPTEPDYATPNPYNYRFTQTHGIHKADDGGVWLIEIGKDNGVLAMPLPIFRGTDSPAFLAFIDTLGDTDTMNVLFEFGGLPTGEEMPSGATLTTAIADGKVLQLLTDTDVIDAFRDTDYGVDKAGLWTGAGWAFSGTGRVADNIAFWYKDFSVVTGSGTQPREERFQCCQHWRFTISLNSTPADGFPYGTGTATLDLIEDTFLINDVTDGYGAPLVLIPGIGAGDSLTQYSFPGRRDFTIPGDEADVFDIHAPIWLFYDGETLETVRNYPVPEGFYWAVNGFAGDSLDLGTTYSLEEGSSALIIPAWCREGYVLIRPDMTANFLLSGAAQHTSTFLIYQHGYFADVGLLEFTPIEELFQTAIDSSLPDTFDFYSWASYWVQLGTSIIITGRSQFFPSWRFGASINYGPTGGYVMTDGVLVEENGRGPYSGTGIEATRPAVDAYLQDSVADYTIPAETQPRAVTFVGSP